MLSYTGWHSWLKRVKKRLGLHVEALSIPCPNNNVQIVRKPRRAAGTENLRTADERPMVTTLPNDVFLPFAPDKPWLAPLAGWSDLPFRLLCRRFGAAVCCTEMISAKGLIYKSPGTAELFATCPEDGPVVVAVNAKKEEQLTYAEGIYDECRKAGLDVLLDDRKERAGVKFKDCDLIGYPVRVTIGPKAVDDDIIEVKVRKTGEVYNFTRADYLEKVEELLKDL